MLKASLTRKLAKWTLLLHEFEFDIYHRPRVQYVVTDYLSRLESGESGDGVRDEFLDVQIFKIIAEAVTDESVAVEDKWRTDMHQVLSTKLPPEELSQDERKRLAVQSRHSCLL